MTLKECYARMGADYDDVIRRLATEERVRKFLSKLLTDPSYQLLCDALANENYEEAFRAAHSIKGVCMNLGLTVLQASSSALTENLRGGAADADTKRLFGRVKADYENMTAALETLFQENPPFGPKEV